MREFAKKHIEIKDKKSPGLKTLISRSIDHVNSKGFRFDSKLAQMIQKRRGSLFHSAPQMSESDAMDFYTELRAATCLLLLHTLEDLGIDISYLASRYPAMRDFYPFLQPIKTDVQ